MKISVKWDKKIFDWSMFSVAGTCRRWAGWPFFDLEKLVLGQKVPQNALKLEYVFNKSRWANEKVCMCQLSSHLVNQWAQNLRKSPKIMHFPTSKLGLRPKSTSKWLQIAKRHFWILLGICQSTSAPNFKPFHQPLRLQSKIQQKYNSMFNSKIGFRPKKTYRRPQI